jgi:hypothetical protein
MRKFTALIIPAAIAALALPTAPAQAQDYGPNTCLTGFVWREAFAGDVVCVPPSTRTRAKQDNAAAASRRDPSAGYGPFGCQQGYVWREARASDLVCVTPNIRSQAKADNAAAAARRNSIKVSAFSSGGRWQLNVSNINNGRALIVLKHSGGRTLKSWTANVSGNRLSLATGRPNCQQANDTYFLVQDPISKRVGRSQNVSANCVRID